MSCLRSIATLVAFILPTMSQAADLDHRYLPRGNLPERPPILEPQVVERQVVEPQVVERVVERVVVVHDRPLIAAVPVQTRVGGAFIFVPGLNGPDAAPVYPLLPFAFGYGY